MKKRIALMLAVSFVMLTCVPSLHDGELGDPCHSTAGSGGIDDAGETSAVSATRSDQPVQQIAHLMASDHEPNDMFGSSVAIGGDTIAVGAHGHDIGINSNQGSAYIYERTLVLLCHK